MGSREPRANAKGRNAERVGSEDRTLIFRRSFWHLPHIAAASTTSRALVVELQSMFNGANNGELFLSVRDGADRLGLSDLGSVSNAFSELEALGLITMTVEGSFAMKAGETSRARAYRLNWISPDGKCVAGEKLAPLDFAILTDKQKRRIAARSGALDRYLKNLREKKSAVRETRTLMADSVRETRTVDPQSDRETRTLDGENGGNQPTRIVRETTTHILHHIPTPISGHKSSQLDPEFTDEPIAAGKAA